MRFRETLWFKKGELEMQGGEDDTSPPLELLPIEDRYLDDGTLVRSDTVQFGVHTGMTQGIRRPSPIDNAGVGEHLLVGELKRGRRLYLGLLAAGVAALGAALLIFA